MLAIIPARGGSKGLPRKNIKLLGGVPLIAWTIEAAKKSKYLDRIIVSTEDDEIANVAKDYGVEIPFLRPKELATDTSLAIDNYLYTIDRLNREQNLIISNFIVLQPTSPLRNTEDIDCAIDLFHKKKADSVISMTEMAYPPVWAKRINEDGIIEEYFTEISDNGLKNRQAIEKAYIPNGAIFIFKESFLRSNCNYYSDKTYSYIMPQNRSVDIDNEIDFDFAKFLLGLTNGST